MYVKRYILKKVLRLNSRKFFFVKLTTIVKIIIGLTKFSIFQNQSVFQNKRTKMDSL